MNTNPSSPGAGRWVDCCGMECETAVSAVHGSRHPVMTETCWCAVLLAAAHLQHQTCTLSLTRPSQPGSTFLWHTSCKVTSSHSAEVQGHQASVTHLYHESNISRWYNKPTFRCFRLKIHQNNQFLLFCWRFGLYQRPSSDESLLIETETSIKKVRIGCFDEFSIWNIYQPKESVYWYQLSGVRYFCTGYNKPNFFNIYVKV